MNYNLNTKMIDCLRGLAASAVFFSHSDASHLATNEWLTANKGFLGSFGVYIFFCLSGYLIWRSGTRLIGTPNGIKLYAIHRVTRLMPLYLVNIIVVAGLVEYIGSQWVASHDPWIIFRHLIFSQDLYPSVSRGINPVLWTLTHEALFYLLAALMLMANFRNPVVILAASLLLCFIFQAYGIVEYFKFSQIFYSFALGIFIAEANKTVRIAICTIVAGLAAYTFFDTRLTSYSAPLSGISVAMLSITFTIGRRCNRLTSRLLSPLAFLGVISYSLYIWHYQIINIMEYHLRFFIDNVPGFSDSKFVRGLVTSFICVGISYISYLFIEKPSMGKLRIALERKAEISPAPEK